MRIWDPHAFTPLGAPVTPTASPALRVIEGEATTDQLAAAQHAFYRFCMHTRLSAVPNPAEIGRLPDGSRYRITDIAGVRTMELWPEDDSRRPGIGVVIDGTRWLLRPPGRAMEPSSGNWRSEEVTEFNGGVGTVYGAGGGRYFVEGGDGTSCGNKRLTDPFFGMGFGIYLHPRTTHLAVRVSDPIMFNGYLEQLKLDGTTLKRRARGISKTGLKGDATGVGGREETTYLMPPSSEGEYWGLLTAHSDKKKVVACRIASDVSSWFFEIDHIRQSVVMWRDKYSAGMDEIVVKSHAPAIAKRDPVGAPDESAPRYSRWERDTQVNNKTIYITYSNPSVYPGAPPTITTDGVDNTVSGHYTETCDYSATVNFRRYVDFTGEIREDALKYEDKSVISVTSKSGTYGFDREGYVDSVRHNSNSTSAKTTRTGTLTLFGVQPLKIYEFVIDLAGSTDGDGRWDMKFSSYAYGSSGEIIGYNYAGSASAAALRSANATIKYAMEQVLMHDSQFGVAATVRVEAKTTTAMQEGYPRYTVSSENYDEYDNAYDLARSVGNGHFPLESHIETDTRTDELTVEMIFYGPDGKDSTTITVPPQVHADLLIAMKELRGEISSPSSRGSPDETIKNGLRQNGYRYEQSVQEVLLSVLDYVTEALYSKDPKTGSGFFSCTWDDGVGPEVRRNKVVGPWGWEPAASKTPIANDAKVFSTTSV